MQRVIRGFTLVEVVIAITLLSMIMLGLVAALRTFANSGARLEELSLRSDNIRLVERFLREALGASSPRLHVRNEDLGAEPWFRGSPGELIWLGAVPARHGIGGLYHLRLSLSDEGGRERLVLQMLPFTGDSAVPDWTVAPQQTLLDGVERFGLAYQRLGQDVWSDIWDDRWVLPARVRMRVSSDGAVWPDLVFRVLAAEPGDLSGQSLSGVGGQR